MKDSIALIEIDLKNVDKARKEWPFFKDRRPDSYEEILYGSEHGAERIE
jgi:predicted amidohydrolase